MSTLFLVTSLLLWLTSLAALYLLTSKLVRPTLQSLQLTMELQLKQDKERGRALSQALNLLASKDPIAYQMIQAATPEPMANTGYTGPYMSGEEYEQLLQEQSRQDKLWKDAGLNDGDE
jgi:hypothetical protein